MRFVKVLSLSIFLSGMIAFNAYAGGIDVSSPLGDGTPPSSLRAVEDEINLTARAEEDIRASDCSIAKAQLAIEKMQEELVSINQQQADLLGQRDATIKENLERLENTFGPAPSGAQFAVDAAEKLGAATLAQFAAVIDAADKAVVLFSAGADLVSNGELNRKIRLNSAKFQGVRDEISYRTELLRDDWIKRDARIEDWEKRGVRFQRNFYGMEKDCGMSTFPFDGVWGNDKPLFKIKGNVFRFLTENQYKYTGYCVANYSEFTYQSESKAQVKFHNVCPDGSQGIRGIDKLEIYQGEVYYSACRGAQDGQEPTDCPEARDTYLTVRKIED